jgi:glycosyltransferase involved in cell wall biosynthesis
LTDTGRDGSYCRRRKSPLLRGVVVLDTLDIPLRGLEGKTVVIIHPAWHSCGSHAVFCSQVVAYRALGARVLALAVGTTLDQGSRNRRFWSHYYGAAGDLAADERYHTGPSRYSLLLDGQRLRRAVELVGCDYAAQMAGLAELAPMPGGLARRRDIDLIHCNHYFNMPLALRLKALSGAPILLETHDVQSRQYELRGATRLFSGVRSSLAEMEASELALVAKADALAHINAEEAAYFAERLPGHRHVLLYPALRARRADHRHYFLAVASANYPNYLSIAWLLERVLALAEPINLAIVGNIDHEFQARAPGLYRRHRDAFKGRVDDLEGFYDAAAAVLLPVVAGHGLAIKTVEALQSGAPLIATRMAFRGMAIEADRIENVRLADQPLEFAQHLDEVSAAAARAEAVRLAGAEAAAARRGNGAGAMTAAELHMHQIRAGRARSGSRKVFTELFSFPRYVGRLDQIAAGLLGGGPAWVPAPADAREAAGACLNGAYGGVALH